MSPTITTPAMTQARDDPRHGRLHESRSRRAARPSTSARTSGRSACVLYEMLTGTRAFARRRRLRHARARCMREEPDWTRAARDALTRARHAAAALPAEGSEAAAPRHRRRAPGAGGRVRDGRAADDGVGHVIGATADGWPGWPHSPSRRWRSSRSPFPRCGICAKRHRPRRPRRASTSSRPPPTRSRRRLRSRPTAGRSSSWPPVTARPVSGCGPWRRRRRSRWRHRGRHVSLLVARQPLGRLLRRRRAEAARYRRRRAADPGAGHQRPRRDVERGRRHPVCAEPTQAR